MAPPLPYPLQFVRKDRDRVVLTEHSDFIRRHILVQWLCEKYGKPHVLVALLKEVYVIYIDRTVVDMDDFDGDMPEDAEPEPIQQKLGKDLFPEYEQIRSDLEKCIEILRKVRLRSRGIEVH